MNPTLSQPFASLHNSRTIPAFRNEIRRRRRRRRQWRERIQNASPPQEDESCARRGRSRSNFADPTCRGQSSNFRSRSFHDVASSCAETDEDEEGPGVSLLGPRVPRATIHLNLARFANHVNCHRLSLSSELFRERRKRNLKTILSKFFQRDVTL